MRFDILTIFPHFFEAPFKQSILGKAIEKGLIKIGIHNIRDFALDKHKTTDDSPYGGGDGMVMKAEPIVTGVESIKTNFNPDAKVILTTPQGKRFDQQMASELAVSKGLVIICGRYEGVDERVKELAVDMEISVGDYILSGGELPAMLIVDAVSRLIPDVLGSDISAKDDSFSPAEVSPPGVSNGLLEYPQYTRPVEFEGKSVPKILLRGDHKKIKDWRLKKAFEATLKLRQDLLK